MKKSILVSIASAALLSACGSSSSSTQTDPLSCANYCATITTACTGTNNQYAFIDNVDCNTYCNAIHWNAGTVDPNTHEDTLGCRVAHAQLAANPGPPNPHCWHAGPTGGRLCGSACENYCEVAEEACQGANQLYADHPTCLAACAGMTDDLNVTAQTGNDVQCRIWHLSEALTAKALGDPARVATHCAHGKVVSAVCVGAAP
jgi:hypothetical protein